MDYVSTGSNKTWLASEMRGASTAKQLRVLATEKKNVHAAHAAAHFIGQLEHDCRLFLRTANRPRIEKPIAALIEGKPDGLVHAHRNLVGQRANVHRLIFWPSKSGGQSCG
jgi:hypothetical protein